MDHRGGAAAFVALAVCSCFPWARVNVAVRTPSLCTHFPLPLIHWCREVRAIAQTHTVVRLPTLSAMEDALVTPRKESHKMSAKSAVRALEQQVALVSAARRKEGSHQERHGFPNAEMHFLASAFFSPISADFRRFPPMAVRAFSPILAFFAPFLSVGRPKSCGKP